MVDFEGEEWLYYAPPRIDVGIIRGTVADENGNISLEKEGVLLEQLSIAQAAKRWGGIVICQVERVVKAGSFTGREQAEAALRELQSEFPASFINSDV